MKRIVISLILITLFLSVLCGCGGGTHYTLFAYDYDGHIIASEDMTSELTLNENGAGRMTFNGVGGRITSRIEEDGSITIQSEGSTMYGTLQDGILTLDPGDGRLLYYAADDANISSVPVMSFEEYLFQSVRGDNE